MVINPRKEDIKLRKGGIKLKGGDNYQAKKGASTGATSYPETDSNTENTGSNRRVIIRQAGIGTGIEGTNNERTTIPPPPSPPPATATVQQAIKSYVQFRSQEDSFTAGGWPIVNRSEFKASQSHPVTPPRSRMFDLPGFHQLALRQLRCVSRSKDATARIYFGDTLHLPVSLNNTPLKQAALTTPDRPNSPCDGREFFSQKLQPR